MKWSWPWSRRIWERRMDAEFQFHLESQAQDYVGQGMSREEAEQRARREFGGLELAKEECRDGQPLESLGQVLRDIRYAFRSLSRSPGFAAVAVVTLALGIGANTAIFSVLKRMVLDPPPYRQPERLVFVWLNNLTLKHFTLVSYGDFRDWQRAAHPFERIAALRFQDRNLTAPGTAEHLKGREISSGFFETLGVRLLLGREFTAEEDQEGGPPAAILSDAVWRDRFGGSGAAIGKPVTLDGVDYTVVGVLPAGFHFWSDSDVYTPAGRGDPLTLRDRSVHSFLCVARLRADVTLGQAQAEMSTIQQHIDEVYAAAERGQGIGMLRLQEQLAGDVRPTLLLLMAAVGLVLLIACANVANLLLARSAARGRELAIRAALGATRARIVRQLITESVLLAVAGGAAGLLIAFSSTRLVMAAMPANLLPTPSAGLSLPALFFAFGVSGLAGILFGLAPALRSSKIDLEASLKEGGRGSSAGQHRAQSTLVILQMALTLVLLAGAGLLFRTIRQLWELSPGFDARHVITFKVGLSPSATHTASGVRTAFRQLVERVRQIPGVEAADFTTLVPLSPADNAGPFWITAEPPRSLAEAPRALYQEVGPDYLRAMGIPLLEGRFFSKEDTAGAAPVVVVDSALARAYFPEKNPIGETIHIAHWGPGRIVGVIGHVSHYGLANPNPYTQNEIYISFDQILDEWVPAFYPALTLVVRTPLDMASMLPAIKAAVDQGGSDQPVYDVETLEEFVSGAMASRRFPLMLLVAFAGLALVLASVGIYGVISYSMAQRVREIGIRMALGARPGEIVRMALGEGVRLSGAGAGIGLAAALVIAPALSSFSNLLFGVRPIDPLTFGTVALVMVGAALLACYLPARRAARLDPLAVLRHE